MGFRKLPTSLHLGQDVRLAAVVLMLGLSFTSNAAAHRAGMGLLAALRVVFVRAVTPTLG